MKIEKGEEAEKMKVNKYKAWFQCINGCSGKYELDEIIYKCPECGELLTVVHDMGILKKKTAWQWMKLFDERYRRTEWPFGSGVWGKKEFVCPGVDNDNIVSMYEGASNLFWAERLGSSLGIEDLWIKQCGNSHTGSFKDLGMTVLVSMVKQMISEGKDIIAVACASTGDTSAALSAYCAAAGIQAIVFLPKNKVSLAQLIQPIANDALTLSLDTDFDGCMEIVKEITSKNNIYLANSMNSLRIEGQKTVSIELTQQFDWKVPDWVIIPGGNLGNISAIGKGFSMMKDLYMIKKLPRLVCAQTEKANPLYKSYLKDFEEFKPVKAKKTLASAIQIGNPVSVKKAIKTLKKFNGIVEEATEQELADAAAMGDKTGLFNCPHTGVALAALIKLLKKGVIKKSERVVVISTANGLKFTDFKRKYHEDKLTNIVPNYGNLPVEVEAKYEKVRSAILNHIDKK